MTLSERLTIADRHLEEAISKLQGTADEHEAAALFQAEVALNILNADCIGKKGRAAASRRVDVVRRTAAAVQTMLDNNGNPQAWYDMDRALTALVA